MKRVLLVLAVLLFGAETMMAQQDKAAEKAKKVDKVRREYYNYYTSKHWGHASSYDLSIDSSILGDEQTACFIRDFVLRALEDMR